RGELRGGGLAQLRDRHQISGKAALEIPVDDALELGERRFGRNGRRDVELRIRDAGLAKRLCLHAGVEGLSRRYQLVQVRTLAVEDVYQHLRRGIVRTVRSGKAITKEDFRLPGGAGVGKELRFVRSKL